MGSFGGPPLRGPWRWSGLNGSHRSWAHGRLLAGHARPRGWAAHVGCRELPWPPRSHPLGRAPSTWPVSAAGPGPARPAGGPRSAGHDTRRAAAGPPLGPGWHASGGPCLRGTESAHALWGSPGPGQTPALPTPGRSQRSTAEGFWVHPEGPRAAQGGAARCRRPGRGRAASHEGPHPPRLPALLRPCLGLSRQGDLGDASWQLGKLPDTRHARKR